MPGQHGPSHDLRSRSSTLDSCEEQGLGSWRPGFPVWSWDSLALTSASQRVAVLSSGKAEMVMPASGGACELSEAA